MRSDRLKQVMQEIDPNFDEKNLGMAKFSRFVQEAGQRGLLKLTRLENGQMEVDVADGEKALPRGQDTKRADAAPRQERERTERPERSERDGEENGRRGRRGRRGRGGRDRERGERETPERPIAQPAVREPAPEPRAAAPAPSGEPEMTGERLTRGEAFDLVRRSLAAIGSGEEAVLASDLRTRARQVLGRDSESLSERNFLRILRDAHDADVVDLRKRGNDYEVSAAVGGPSITEQLEIAAPAAGASQSQAARSAATATALRRGMRPRGARGGRGEAPPPELLTVGVVDEFPSLLDAPSAPTPDEPAAADAAQPASSGRKKAAKKSSGGRGRKKATAKSSGDAEAGGDAGTPAAKTAKRGRARKKKTAAPAAAES
jgi:hypothetical protein